MMTDNEIIKALECCYGGIGSECEECPNRETCCDIDVIKITVDLINRQKAEIDRYKINLPHLEQQDEDFCGVLCDFAEELIGKAKSEAIKEFVERLKELPSMKLRENDWVSLLIDRILEEMEGDE